MQASTTTSFGPNHCDQRNKGESSNFVDTSVAPVYPEFGNPSPHIVGHDGTCYTCCQCDAGPIDPWIEFCALCGHELDECCGKEKCG